MPDDVTTPPDFRPSGIRFDWTITAGNMLTVLGGLIAMGAAFVDYRVTIDRHDMRIGNSEVAVKMLQQQNTESIKAQSEMARAIDRLTFQLQGRAQPN